MNPKQIAWLLSNIALITAVYVGHIHGVTAVRYLCVAFIWIMLLVYLVVYVSPEKRKSIRQSPMPKKIEWGVDILVFGLLVISGDFMTAAVYATSCILLSILYNQNQDSR